MRCLSKVVARKTVRNISVILWFFGNNFSSVNIKQHQAHNKIMESLALAHSFLAYEEPAPEVQVNFNLPSSAGMGLVAATLTLSTLAISGSAEAASMRVATNGSNLNVRCGPGMVHCVVGKLSPGQKVHTTGRYRHGWAQLSNGGWVSSAWLASAYRPVRHWRSCDSSCYCDY